MVSANASLRVTSYRISIFEFRNSPSLISGLNVTILNAFHFANLGYWIYETGHYGHLCELYAAYISYYINLKEMQVVKQYMSPNSSLLKHITSMAKTRRVFIYFQIPGILWPHNLHFPSVRLFVATVKWMRWISLFPQLGQKVELCL